MAPAASSAALLYRIIEPGAALHPLELLPVYIVPGLWFCSVAGDWGALLASLSGYHSSHDSSTFRVRHSAYMYF